MAQKKLTPKSPIDQRVPEIIRLLDEAHPDAECALVHNNAFELLVRRSFADYVFLWIQRAGKEYGVSTVISRM